MGLQVHFHLAPKCVYELNCRFNEKYNYGGGVASIGRSETLAVRPVYSSKHPLNMPWSPTPALRATSLVLLPTYLTKRQREGSVGEAKRCKPEPIARLVDPTTTTQPMLPHAPLGSDQEVEFLSCPSSGQFGCCDPKKYGDMNDCMAGPSSQRELLEGSSRNAGNWPISRRH
jgi:hypothetical protein